MQRDGCACRGLVDAARERPLNRVQFLAVGGASRQHCAQSPKCRWFHCAATCAVERSSSACIFSLIRPFANSDATRMAFLMALVFDRPWQMMLAPFTPSSGAPPYSE